MKVCSVTFYLSSCVMLVTMLLSGAEQCDLIKWSEVMKVCKVWSVSRGGCRQLKAEVGQCCFFPPPIVLTCNNPNLSRFHKRRWRNVKTCFSAALLWQTKIGSSWEERSSQTGVGVTVEMRVFSKERGEIHTHTTAIRDWSYKKNKKTLPCKNVWRYRV